MTADIRTAARAETEATAHFGPPDFSAPNDRTIKWATYVQGFTEGAVWAQARVTPTREQIAGVIADEEEYPHPRGYLKHADAVLKLMQGLAEENG